jgi:murein DD-endopeptidase MepM/ murein hydrolase activator NlpD
LRRLAALTLLLLSACTAPRARQKMTFEEMYASEAASQRAEPASPPASDTPRPRSRRMPQARVHNPLRVEESLELRSALLSFAMRARAVRGTVRAGSAMPPAQMDNWEAMNAAVDEFLRRTARETSSRDVVRARVTLEAELEQDARIYGDMPAELSDAVLVRVYRLTRRMAEVRQLATQVKPAKLRFAWPVDPVVVTSTFGSRLHPITGQEREHLGVDLSARRGQLVNAAAKGVVLSAGWNGNHGLQVVLQHEGDVTTRYSHLSRVLVEPGEVLDQGDVVGLAGKTGMATGVHLHFELWRGNEPSDPLEELGPVPDGEQPRNAKGAAPSRDDALLEPEPKARG